MIYSTMTMKWTDITITGVIILQKHLIFFDSNPIIANNHSLNTGHVKRFISNSNKIAISTVTIDEVVRNFRNNEQKQIEKLKDLISDCSRYGIDVSFTQTKNIEDSLSQELKELSVEVLETSLADVNFILEKAMNLKKPFKQKSGKETGGFKDALIWNTWMMHAKEVHNNYDFLIFVTHDGDFIDQNLSVLAPDLIEDVKRYGIPTEKIKVIKNVKSLVEEVIIPETTLGFDLTERDYEDVVEEIIETNLSELESDLIEVITEIIGDEKEPYLINLERKDNINYKEIHHNVEEGIIYIYFTEEFEIDFSYYLLKTEYFEIGKKNIQIEDSNWNDYVYLVSETWYTEVGFEATFSYVDDIGNFAIEGSEYYISTEFVPDNDGSIFDDENEN